MKGVPLVEEESRSTLTAPCISTSRVLCLVSIEKHCEWDDSNVKTYISLLLF